MDPTASAGYDWTGFYVGVFGGVGLQQSKVPGYDAYYYGDYYGDYYEVEVQSVGGELGVSGGYNAQLGTFVLGGEADIAWSSYSVESDQYGGYVESDINWISTLRLKAGMLVGDGMLVYGTAGLAAADIETLVCYDEDCDDGYEYGPEGVQLGLTVGVGAEAKLADNLTVDAKLLYTQFETARATVEYPSGYYYGASFDTSLISARAGLNWQFD